MSALAPTLESFFTERLIGQRRASPHTVAAYRDTIRLLLAYAADRLGKRPSDLDILAQLGQEEMWQMSQVQAASPWRWQRSSMAVSKAWRPARSLDGAEASSSCTCVSPSRIMRA